MEGGKCLCRLASKGGHVWTSKRAVDNWSYGRYTAPILLYWIRVYAPPNKKKRKKKGHPLGPIFSVLLSFGMSQLPKYLLQLFFFFNEQERYYKMEDFPFSKIVCYADLLHIKWDGGNEVFPSQSYVVQLSWSIS